jgi:hypothetical protein
MPYAEKNEVTWWKRLVVTVEKLLSLSCAVENVNCDWVPLTLYMCCRYGVLRIVHGRTELSKSDHSWHKSF